MRARDLLWGMVAVLLVATALRLVACAEVPPGLYHDEAYHGLDALEILRGHFSLYFPANHGREPLFVYLIALAVGLLGRSPFALRLVSFFAGLLAVAATGAMARALFSRRVGLLAAAVLAVTLWHVHLSRVGFRAVLLPLFVSLAVWQGTLGVRQARGQGTSGGWWRHWLAAGILYGLSLYTYMAARFTPIALAAFGLYALAARPAVRRSRSAIGGQLRRGVGLAALAALVTVAPLAAYTIGHPDVVLGRLGQVFVFNPAHVLRTAGMFFVRGDRIWRHNVPWRPVFDPLLGAAFVLGLLVALRRARRDLASGFVLIWTAVMSLPTLLAEDAPHFLRGVGVLPVVVLLPALGLDWLGDRLRPHTPPHSHTLSAGGWMRMALLVLPLLFGLTSTAWAYFGDYASDPMAGYWFERGAVALAGRINRFLGTGWDGARMMRDGLGNQQVYLDPVLWDEWQPQVRFLVAAPEAMTVGLEGTQISKPKAQTQNPEVAVFVWPYGDWRQAPLRLQALLPAPAELTVEEGPLSQGDRDREPYMTYLAFFATPPDPSVSALAHFSGGVELLGVAVTPTYVDSPSLAGGDMDLPSPAGGDEGGIRVRLRWRATTPLAEDYTVFLHYLRDGERIAQADSRPGQGHYPTTAWRPGDVVNDDHDVEGVGAPLPGHDALRFGFWQPESGAVLYLVDEAGNPAGDWIEVPVDG